MWSDREAEHDCLGFNSYISTLSAVCTEKEIAPLTLGIFGSWGQGKTSLMKMLKAHIEQQNDQKVVKTIWFNAWRYEGRDQAQAALIHAILAKLKEDESVLQQAKQLFDRVKQGASVLKLAKFITTSAVTMTPNIKEFLACFEEQSDKLADTMEGFERDFEKLLDKIGVQRIVVFIDDLDRCSTEKVVEVFETIKLFFNIPECTFVIGADREKIKRAVAAVYQVGDQDINSFSKDYLEKIIQLPFRIPEQQLTDIIGYVATLVIRRCISLPGWELLLGKRAELCCDAEKASEKFQQWVTQEAKYFQNGQVQAVLEDLRRILQYAGLLASGLRGNPRQIKRFLNILLLRERLAKENELQVDPATLIKLTVLEYTWEDFFTAVLETFDPANETFPLIEEVLKASDLSPDERDSLDSLVVREAVKVPGLVEFLRAEPHVHSAKNLGAYLYLAQTALEHRATGALAPLDEVADDLATRVASPDRFRSDTAARQTTKQDLPVAQAVIRLLLPSLISQSDERIRANIIGAFDRICSRHKECFPDALAGMQKAQLSSKGASALVIPGFIDRAQKTGFPIPPGLLEFVKTSPVARAIKPNP